MEKNRSSEKTRQPESGWLSFNPDVPGYEISPVQSPTQTVDFDFSTRFELPAHEPSSADELFSDGKILPLPIKSPVVTPTKTLHHHHHHMKQHSVKESITDTNHELNSTQKLRLSGSSTSRGSFWLLGRSVSDGFKSKVSSIYSFRRSKSAGPHDRVNTKHNKNMNISSGGGNQNSNGNTSPFRHKGSTDSSSKRTYYYSGIKPQSQGTGVRIDPVLNVPYLSRASNSPGNISCRSSSNSSIFGYLICKCSN
ncbi:hypothetical protein IHE45_05G134600 [Dioscorea alata]|uniref:Uncharacterized protein n=1 Tax=Dioscorea alata TaxID=55571 RepID=A0ACB7W4U0_DIOAL|nr:hypothetical protein IHE45_05G134600 [Dioscorea alata]